MEADHHSEKNDTNSRDRAAVTARSVPHGAAMPMMLVERNK
jgi:hypothetical protein